jgi:hypothetical protein
VKCVAVEQSLKPMTEKPSLVKNWRKTHKHSDKPHTPDTSVIQIQGDNQVALGFQALYDQYNDPMDE